jgi:hypothetical protein
MSTLRNYLDLVSEVPVEKPEPIVTTEEPVGEVPDASYNEMERIVSLVHYR